MAITPEIMIRIVDLFHNRGWPTSGSKLTIDKQRFDEFSSMISLLNEEELDAVMRISENFEKYDTEKILVGLQIALEFVGVDALRDCETIFVIPIKSPGDLSENKSGDKVSYEFYYSVLGPYLRKVGTDVVVHNVRSARSILGYQNRRRSLVFGVDDFVGTGDTAEKFINSIESVKSETDNVVLLSAASMVAGASAIERRGYPFFTGTFYSRGVSDCPLIDNPEKILEVIDNIEDKLDIGPEYRRGYKGSEALLSFTRTPDNTFPMYWANFMKGGGRWPAPFPR